MAGVLLPILPKRTYDFGALNISPGVQQFIVAERIDVSQYIDCMVAVRIHSANGVSSSNTIQFDVFGDGFTDDDPSNAFRTTDPLFGSSLIATTSSSPALYTYGGTVHGQFAILVATVTKTVAGVANVTVSIDIALRTPDPTILET